jgi:hypothetical protein
MKWHDPGILEDMLPKILFEISINQSAAEYGRKILLNQEI